MDLFLYGVITFLICLALWNVWALWCNHRTADQRGEIIDVAFSNSQWICLMGLYDAVPYDQHMRDLMLLRDPMARYDQRLRDAVSAYRAKLTAQRAENDKSR